MLRFHTPLVEPDVRFSRIRLSDKDSCVRPRDAARSSLELDEPQGVVDVTQGKACSPPSRHLVLPTQPLAEPVSSVAVHCPISPADRPQGEVVAPPVQDAVEPTYYFLVVQQFPSTTRHLADLFTDAQDFLLRRSGTEIRSARSRRVVAAEGLAQEVKRVRRHVANMGFRLVNRQLQLLHHVPHGVHRLVGGAAAADHESSSLGESHPQALTEPDVNRSAHPAPIVQSQVESRSATSRTGWVLGEPLGPASEPLCVDDDGVV